MLHALALSFRCGKAALGEAARLWISRVWTVVSGVDTACAQGSGRLVQRPRRAKRNAPRGIRVRGSQGFMSLAAATAKGWRGFERWFMLLAHERHHGYAMRIHRGCENGTPAQGAQRHGQPPVRGAYPTGDMKMVSMPRVRNAHRHGLDADATPTPSESCGDEYRRKNRLLRLQARAAQRAAPRCRGRSEIHPQESPEELPLRFQPCAGTVLGRERRTSLRRMAAESGRRSGGERGNGGFRRAEGLGCRCG